MKLFLDTANLDEIRRAKSWGVLSGCTTNPTLLSKEHNDWQLQMKEVCNEVPGPVSLETTETCALLLPSLPLTEYFLHILP